MNILEIRDFSFTYPGEDRQALSHVNMAVAEGTLNVLCGKSGCGKSTLLTQLKSVLAIHGKKSGQILYRGRPIEAVDHRTQSSEIGFVLQSPENQIVTDKVWHELAFGLESLGLNQAVIRLRVAEMASYFGIQDWFDQDVTELSGGQRQLLNLAAIMAMHPSLLILDEPTAQLDPIAASDFLETVKKINRDIGTTVILTEHRLSDILPDADRVFVLDEGKMLTEGTPREIGVFLKEHRHSMFLSMPVPMQIYAGVESDAACPLTVSEGRRWIDALMHGKEKRRENKENKEGKDISQKGNKGKDISQKENSRKKLMGHHNGASAVPPAVQMRDVWFRYEKDSPDVVRDLSLTVAQGEFYALIGGNGTGKSTTLSLISRVRCPYRGRIDLNGKDIRRYSENELYRGYLGVLPQNPQSMFIKKTVREDLYAVIGGRREKKSEEYGADMKKAEAIRGMVSLTKLEGLLERHPYDLSGGEQQRLALAKVLLLRPRLLLLDEPTKGMDGEFKQAFGSLLKKLQSHGLTILMVSHDVEFVAEYADRVGLFFQGNVVTSQSAREIFAGNSFYTTAANRMARKYFPDAVTGKEVIACLRAEI